ncbi:hypothetical protein PARMER_01964 [Parabacteroides merdae ATCC 43184]|nr:hypothetical protein PARMER_01964 [Parabacteroides merdae ATCC 43184]
MDSYEDTLLHSILLLTIPLSHTKTSIESSNTNIYNRLEKNYNIPLTIHF